MSCIGKTQLCSGRTEKGVRGRVWQHKALEIYNCDCRWWRSGLGGLLDCRPAFVAAAAPEMHTSTRSGRGCLHPPVPQAKVGRCLGSGDMQGAHGDGVRTVGSRPLTSPLPRSSIAQQSSHLALPARLTREGMNELTGQMGTRG